MMILNRRGGAGTGQGTRREDHAPSLRPDPSRRNRFSTTAVRRLDVTEGSQKNAGIAGENVEERRER
jgi:hypothetical protein